MAFPLIVSFFTENTPYEEEVKRLARSCNALGLETHIESLPSAGSWVANCAMKGPFMLKCLEQLKKPILWLDADAEVVRRPELFESPSFDVAAYCNGDKLLSGTLYMAPTPAAIELADDWTRLCRRHRRQWDQVLLQRALERSSDVAFERLPQGYCKIFDSPWRPGEKETAYITHHQASRRFKRTIN